MDAHGGVQEREAVDELERGPRRVRVPARDEDPLDARESRGADHLIDVGFEAVGLEMAMGIDEAHRRIVADAPPDAAAGRSYRGSAS
jgi:hypothetical protein